MKTVVLLGVLVLLLLFLSWRNPTEHMTLVKGIPVVETSDAMALQAVWIPDPAELQKQKDDMAIRQKASACAGARINGAGGDLGERIRRIHEWQQMNNGGPDDTDDRKVDRAKSFIAKNNC